MKKVPLLLIASHLVLMSACGEERREVDTVQIENGVSADIAPGDVLRVEGDVRVERADGSLVVRPEHGNHGDALVRLPWLRTIRARGNAEVLVHGLDRHRVSIDAAGTSRVVVSGTAEELSLTMGGTTEIEAEALRVQFAEVEAHGNAAGTIWVEGAVSGRVTGNASLVILGGAAVGELEVTGSADVTAPPPEPESEPGEQ